MSFVVQIHFLKLDRPRGTFRMWCLHIFFKERFPIVAKLPLSSESDFQVHCLKGAHSNSGLSERNIRHPLFSIFPPWIKENNIESKGLYFWRKCSGKYPEVPVTPFVLFIWKLFYSLNLQRKDTGQTVCSNSQNFLVEDPLKRRTRLKMQLI